jgi:hypothetical protein
MKKGTILGAIGCLAAAFGASQAAPITTPPPTLIATGEVKAVYIFANAADTSILNETSPMTISTIFCNHSSGGCTASPTGDTMSLGVQSGPLVFSLANLTTGATYKSNTPDAHGAYHAVFSTNYSTFGLGPLPSAAATALAGLPDVTFVAWEDRDATNGSDFDYNDLVFAFSNTKASVPEPLSLSLLGAGLLGLAVFRRRKS